MSGADQVVVPTRRPKSGFWTFKNITLKLHLWLGLASALILLSLGVTGAAIAFENELDRWVSPGLYYVTPGPQMLPQAQLIATVEQRFAPERVSLVTLGRYPNFAQVMNLSGGPKTPQAAAPGHRVWVDPYTGNILGDRTGRTGLMTVIGSFHRFHQTMGMGRTGARIGGIASAVLVFETILGLILWWRVKRFTISMRRSWFRVCFDAHTALGLYSAVVILVLALTGCVIGFQSLEELIFKATNSGRLTAAMVKAPNSTPGPGTVTADQALAIARQTYPEATVAVLQRPVTATGSYRVDMRVPVETSLTVHTYVWVDQYSGAVLKKFNFGTDLPGYKIVRLNRSLHTGDIWGLTGQAIAGLSCLVLAVLVVTGAVIWWKKLAV